MSNTNLKHFNFGKFLNNEEKDYKLIECVLLRSIRLNYPNNWKRNQQNDTKLIGYLLIMFPSNLF